MPTIVGIFIFISNEIFMLPWTDHEESFITSGQGVWLVFIFTMLNVSA